MHTLDMIICPYNKLYDEVEFIPKQGENELSVENIEASFCGFKPSVFLDFYSQKLQLIADRLGAHGILNVKKNVPLGAGLGGSTASVVAALKAVCEYLKSVGEEPDFDDGFLLSLGSDVPCMLLGGACRVRGVGELLTPIACDIPSDIEVRIAGGGSDSGKCYAEFDRLMSERGCDKCDCESLAESVEQAILNPRNDLTEAAIALNPEIGKLIEEMKKEYKFVLMSGSGSAVISVGKLAEK